MSRRQPKRRGIYLVKPNLNDPETLLREAMAEKFKTGELVPHSGIYKVQHSQHRLPHEVTLLRANPFPPCAKCGNKVTYRLLRAVTVDRFAVTLNALPELAEETRASTATAGGDQEKAS